MNEPGLPSLDSRSSRSFDSIDRPLSLSPRSPRRSSPADLRDVVGGWHRGHDGRRNSPDPPSSQGSDNSDLSDISPPRILERNNDADFSRALSTDDELLSDSKAEAASGYPSENTSCDSAGLGSGLSLALSEEERNSLPINATMMSSTIDTASQDTTVASCAQMNMNSAMGAANNAANKEATIEPLSNTNTAATSTAIPATISSPSQTKKPPSNTLSHLEIIPSTVLSSILTFLGPQSSFLGVASTTKLLRTDVKQNDAAWKLFSRWRCTSRLTLASTNQPAIEWLMDDMLALFVAAADTTDPSFPPLIPPTEEQLQRRREAQADLERLSVQRKRNQKMNFRWHQLQIRLQPWRSAATSFEEGMSPDESYFSLYKRLHVDGKEMQQKRQQDAVMANLKRCNRPSRTISGEGGIGIDGDDGNNHNHNQGEEDPTLMEALLEGGPMLDNNDNNDGIDEDDHDGGDQQLATCGNIASDWCDNSTCTRARCRNCNSDQGSVPSSSPAAIGQTIIKCGWCNVRLCRGCANNNGGNRNRNGNRNGNGGTSSVNLTYCDGCHRGICADCLPLSAHQRRPLLGRTVPCAGTDCNAHVCWTCARSVGRCKSPDTIANEIGSRSPSRPSSPLRSMTGSGGRFQSLSFASIQQFEDKSPRQIHCVGCAEAKVAKLNLYRRIDMSPALT